MPRNPAALEQRPALHWTPHLIKRLRGKRTPHPAKLAGQLPCAALSDWQLVGSMTLLGELESARADIAKLFRTSLERTSRHLAE